MGTRLLESFFHLTARNSLFFTDFGIYDRGGGEGAGGRGFKGSFFVQQTFGNNWGAFFPPGALPVKSYWRLTAKNCVLTKRGSQAWG
jgi:hypothetical protein